MKRFAIILFTIGFLATSAVAAVNPLPLATLTDGFNSNDEFATSVAISADGTIVVVGASAADNNVGATYIYVEPPTGWASASTYTAKLTDGSPLQNLLFGYGVAISPDGNTIVVGAPNATVPTGSQGAILVFQKPVSGWASTSHYSAALYSSAYLQGGALGAYLATDGTTVVAGEPQGPYGPSAAFVFVKPASGWHNMIETAELTPSDLTIGDDLGPVGISGNTIVVGGQQNETVNAAPGAAYVYVKPANGWQSMSETAKLSPSDARNYGEFGSSVAIQGSTIAVGSTEDMVGNGAAYIFIEPSGGWKSTTETAEFTPSNGYQNEWFGFAVALAGPKILAVGAPAVFAGNVGQTYGFVEPASGWQTTSNANYDITSPHQLQSFGAALAASKQFVVVGANYISNTGPGAVVIYGKK